VPGWDQEQWKVRQQAMNDGLLFETPGTESACSKETCSLHKGQQRWCLMGKVTGMRPQIGT